MLIPLELERERPFFESAPLVDIGGRSPFFDECIQILGYIGYPPATAKVYTKRSSYLPNQVFLPLASKVLFLKITRTWLIKRKIHFLLFFYLEYRTSGKTPKNLLQRSGAKGLHFLVLQYWLNIEYHHPRQ